MTAGLHICIMQIIIIFSIETKDKLYKFVTDIGTRRGIDTRHYRHDAMMPSPPHIKRGIFRVDTMSSLWFRPFVSIYAKTTQPLSPDAGAVRQYAQITVRYLFNRRLSTTTRSNSKRRLNEILFPARRVQFRLN